MPDLPDELPDVDPTSDVATNWRNARAEIKRLKDNEAKFRQASIANSIRLAGYDPDVGVVKLLREKWEESLDPDHITPDDFKSFAVTFGVEPAAPATSPAGSQSEGSTPQPPGQPAQPSAYESDAQRFQSRVDTLQAASTAPVAPPTLDQDIAKAEQDGRTRDSFNLKFRKMKQMTNPLTAGMSQPFTPQPVPQPQQPGIS